jgi:molybdopterin/thiamine biosynthesis adenylyltransferase
MDPTEEARFERQIRLFGKRGQNKIGRTKIAILGLGGVGSHIAQQLAYLGIKDFVLVDGDIVKDHNLNRLVGADFSDIGALKTEVAKKMISRITPAANVSVKNCFLPDNTIEKKVADVDIIFGAFDNDYPRLLTTDFASKLHKIYIDSATGVEEIEGQPLIYGGRVIVSGESRGCLFCLNELDQREIHRAQMDDTALKIEAKIYGIPLKELRKASPSVITINGVISSLACTEALAIITGLRTANKFLDYRAESLTGYREKSATVVKKVNRSISDTCPYCYAWGLI